MLDLAVLDLLKFRLLADGVYVHPSAAGAWRELYGGPLTLGEYATTAGIGLLLPGDRYVNAPLIAEPDVRYSCVLRHEADGFFLVHRSDEPVPVEVMPVATFHDDEMVDRFDGQVRPMRSYGVTHTDRCRVSPIAGCAWKCRFCDLPYELTYRKKHTDNLLEVIIAADKDPLTPARHVLVSGGTPRGGRAGESDEDWIDSVYCDLAERSPLPIEVMMAPRRDHTHPARMRQAGVRGLSINFEISDPKRAALITPQKAQYSRVEVLRYIERAVDEFEPFAIQSLMVFGAAIEPLESTLEGVRDLAERGCVPVLSPFRPHPITPMADAPAATFDEIVEVYRRSVEICVRAGTGVLPGPRCVPCHHNTIAVPVDVPFYLSSQQEGVRVACPTS